MKQFIFAASLCLLPLANEGGAQPERPGADRVTCSSYDGRRTFCTANTRGGVRLLRQIGGTCRENFTWGHDTRGVWVDRGCRAEFELSNLSASGPAIPVGTTIPVRTNERIDAKKSDGRIFSGVVSADVLNADGVVAIPRGSEAELLVRSAGSRVLVLDLESLTVNGRQYDVSAGVDRIGSNRRDGIGTNKRTAKFVGGGALLGTIIGAVTGGGTGAAIGAAAGAGGGAGVQLLTRGAAVRVPAESLLTFRLDQALQIQTSDGGYTRRGKHFH